MLNTVINYFKSLFNVGAPAPTGYVYMTDLPVDTAVDLTRLLISQSQSGSTNTSISISLSQIKTLFGNATLLVKAIDPTGTPTSADANSIYVNILSRTIWVADLSVSPAVWRAQTFTTIGTVNPVSTQLGLFFFNTTDASFWVNANGVWTKVATGSGGGVSLVTQIVDPTGTPISTDANKIIVNVISKTIWIADLISSPASWKAQTSTAVSTVAPVSAQQGLYYFNTTDSSFWIKPSTTWIKIAQGSPIFLNTKIVDPVGIPTASDASTIYVNVISGTIFIADLISSPARWKAQTSTTISNVNPAVSQLGQFFFNTTDSSLWINNAGQWVKIPSGGSTGVVIVRKAVDPTGVPIASDANTLYVNTVSKTIWIADTTITPNGWKPQTSTTIGAVNPPATQLGQFYFNTTNSSLWINNGGTWIQIPSGGSVADVLYDYENNYNKNVVLANSGGNMTLGAGAVGARQLQFDNFAIYGRPVIDNNSFFASQIVNQITIIISGVPFYIYAVNGDSNTRGIYVRNSPTSSSYSYYYPTGTFGSANGTIQALSYSGSGSIFWIMVSGSQNLNIAKLQLNGDGTVSIVGRTNDVFQIIAVSNSYLTTIYNFAVSSDTTNTGIFSFAGSNLTPSDGYYLYYKTFSISGGGNITIGNNSTRNTYVVSSQLIDLVSATVSSGQFYYACTTDAIYKIDTNYVVTQLSITFVGQLESTSIYANKILFATVDNVLHVYDVNTDTQSTFALPPDFVFTTVGVYVAYYDGTNYYYYGEGSLNSGVDNKYLFSPSTISGLKTLQPLLLGSKVLDINNIIGSTGQVLSANANGNTNWASIPQQAPVSIYALTSLPASGQNFYSNNVTNILNQIPNSPYYGSVTLPAGIYLVTVYGGFQFNTAQTVSDFFIGFGTAINGTLLDGSNVIADGEMLINNFASTDTQVASATGYIQIAVPTNFVFWFFRNNTATLFSGGTITITKYT